MVKTAKQTRLAPDMNGAPVHIEFQVVETVRDTIRAEPGGELSLGQVVDGIVRSHFDAGKELGRLTLDLTEFSQEYCPGRRRTRDDRD